MRLVLSFFRKIDKAGFEGKRAGLAGMAYKRKGREMETRIVKIKEKAAVRDEELLEAAEAPGFSEKAALWRSRRKPYMDWAATR